MVHKKRNPGIPARYEEYYVLTVAFFSGMAVMGVEICSSRLMAPFFGTSLSVWSVIIGSVMIALTVGYYFGGILADKYPRMSFLGIFLFFASLFMIFLPYLSQPVMEITLKRFAQEASSSSSGGGSGNHAILAALTVCALIIAAPVVVLGMTSPFLIRLDSLRSSAVGRVSGKVFAFSTLGSILGTFLPALLLIPVIGTRLSFLLFGGLLLCVSIPSLHKARLFFCSVAAIALTVALFSGIFGYGTGFGKYLVYEKETNYQHVRIFRTPISGNHDQKASHATFILTDAGLGLQSMWVENQAFTDSWQDFFAIIPRIYDVCSSGAAPKRLLLIGLGGACAPYMMSQFYPDIAIDGVEIDGGLIDAAKPYFPFASVKNLNIHISDGRYFLNTTLTKYDVVVIDAFRPPHIPFHLATTDFFEEVKQSLVPDGIMAMNVGSRGEERVFKGIANTVARVFPFVYFARYFSPDDRTLVFSSRFLIASRTELHLDKLEPEEKLFAVDDPGWRGIFNKMRNPLGYDSSQETYFRRVEFNPNGTLFRDDLSSLEMLSEKEFLGVILGRDK